MAEIKIEKKKPILPWILLIAGILALLYYLFIHDKNDNNDKTVDKTEVVVADSTAVTIDKVAEYNAFISKDNAMDMNHEYSSEAILKLIDATEAVAMSNGVDIKSDLDAARADASEITEDAMKLNHADKIKSAGTIALQAMKKIQTEKFQNLSSDVTMVQNSLEKIKPAMPTLDQKDAVKDFFSQAGDLLTKMKTE